jgi:hypothetical protein
MPRWWKYRKGKSGPLRRMKLLFHPGKNLNGIIIRFKYILVGLEKATEYLCGMNKISQCGINL